MFGRFGIENELLLAKVGGERNEEWLDLLANYFTVVDKRHFTVELIEITIKTVGSGVFVTEARGDLEIFVNATNHEELLELLRRLRQGIKSAWVKPGGHEKITGAFRGRVGKNRCGDFGEIVVVHIITNETIEFGTAL